MFLVEHIVSGHKTLLKQEVKSDQDTWALFLEACKKAQGVWNKKGQAQYVSCSVETGLTGNNDCAWDILWSFELELGSLV